MQLFQLGSCPNVGQWLYVAFFLSGRIDLRTEHCLLGRRKAPLLWLQPVHSGIFCRKAWLPFWTSAANREWVLFSFYLYSPRNIYISYCLLEKPDQGGIISALTSLQGVDSSRGLYAAGSFGGSAGVYSESNGGKRVGPLLQGPRLGVSQVKFAVPASGATPWLLVAGGRADSEVEQIYSPLSFPNNLSWLCPPDAARS